MSAYRVFWLGEIEPQVLGCRHSLELFQLLAETYVESLWLGAINYAAWFVIFALLALYAVRRGRER